MKSIRSILILSVVVIAIIVFWLSPGINTAKDTEYVRRYEDTEHRPKATVRADSSVREQLHKKQQAETSVVSEKKVYKEERISSRDKLSEITPEKFSRAIQFEDEIVTIPEDSVAQPSDTTKIIQ